MIRCLLPTPGPNSVSKMSTGVLDLGVVAHIDRLRRRLLIGIVMNERSEALLSIVAFDWQKGQQSLRFVWRGYRRASYV